MTNSIDEIKHDGIIDYEDDHYYYVVVKTSSACSSCHAKSACQLGDSQDRIIEVTKLFNQDYGKGDKVKIVMVRSNGLVAVFLGYILPFLILLTMLIILNTIINEQGIAALLALLILVPYYLILYRFRKQLKKKFSFRIE